MSSESFTATPGNRRSFFISAKFSTVLNKLWACQRCQLQGKQVNFAIKYCGDLKTWCSGWSLRTRTCSTTPHVLMTSSCSGVTHIACQKEEDSIVTGVHFLTSETSWRLLAESKCRQLSWSSGASAFGWSCLWQCLTHARSMSSFNQSRARVLTSRLTRLWAPSSASVKTPAKPSVQKLTSNSKRKVGTTL